MSDLPEEVGLSSSALKRIHDVMSNYVAQTKIPGVTITVVRRGKPILFEFFGMMDIQSKKPIQSDTIFRIKSMTKPIVSVAALMLYEAGQIRLDDPISMYIPEFSTARVFVGSVDGNIELAELERPITVYHLLTHTSGLSYGQHPTTESLYTQIDVSNPKCTLGEIVSKLAQLPLAHQPGTRWTYGLSHDVLGRVIEVAAGTSLDQYLHEKIFAPLNMLDTAFCVPVENIERLTALYEIEADSRRLQAIQDPFDRLLTCGHKLFLGGGGLVSTAHDYLQFAQMLLNDGKLGNTQVLTSETVKLMTQNHLTGSLFPIRFGDWEAKGEGYGLGVGVIVDPTVSELAGSQGAYTWSGGASTHFWIDPEEALVGLILSHYVPMFYYPIHRELRSLIYQAIAHERHRGS